MEKSNLKTEATQVTGCKKCNKKSNTTQKIVFVMGGLMFGLSIYGLISLIIDIKSLF